MTGKAEGVVEVFDCALTAHAGGSCPLRPSVQGGVRRADRVFVMEPMLFLTLLSTAAAIFSAFFGLVQADQARKARKDAKEHGDRAEVAERKAIAARDAAVQAQQESASAAGRIAEVLEQQAAEKRAAAAIRSSPWTDRPGATRKNGHAIVMVNTSKHSVFVVSRDVERAPYLVRCDPDPEANTVQPGESFEVYWARAAGDPPTSTLVIKWRWEDSEEVQTTRLPLTR